jgi:hypothetical protein
MENLFRHIGDEEKIWIYQADRPLSDQEALEIQKSGDDFVAGWAAHGKKLKAGVMVLHRLFVIIHVDEAQANASGCSIDSSVGWITSMGKKYGIDFFNRMNIVYLDEHDEPVLCSPEEFEALAASGFISAETIVFNNMVYKGSSLKAEWQCPASQGWQSRYLPAEKTK